MNKPMTPDVTAIISCSSTAEISTWTFSSEAMIRLDDPRDAERLASWVTADQILTLHSQEGTLEDVFINLAGRPL